jgi:hypothetical protein
MIDGSKSSGYAGDHGGIEPEQQTGKSPDQDAPNDNGIHDAAPHWPVPLLALARRQDAHKSRYCQP